MQRVISISRRTDIPAFYTPWLLGRLRAGYCHIVNPYAGQVYRVPLAPEDCLALVFWTRNPAPLLPHLDELDARGYRYYFLYTLNGYPRALEPHGPPVDHALDTFRALSARLGPERVRWRYDPIVLSSVTPREYHLEQFARLAAELAGHTTQCVLSFATFYGKTVRRFAQVTRETGITFEQPPAAEQQALVRELVALSAPHGIALYSCCSEALLVEGVRQSRCIDPDLIARLVGDPLQALSGLRPEPTRPGCGCVTSVDIGAYDTCLFGCEYCYATSSHAAAQKRHARHDPADTALWRPEGMEGKDLDTLAVSIKKGLIPCPPAS